MTEPTSPYPASESAEKGILSCFLHNSAKVYPLCLAQGASPDWFSEEDRSTLFGMFMDMGQQGKTVDFITSINWILDHKIRLNTPVPDALLAELLSFVPNAAQIADYLDIVKRNAARKLAIMVCQRVEKEIREDCSDLQSVFDATAAPFTEVQGMCVEEDDSGYDKKAMLSYFDHMEEMASGRASPEFFRTGIPTIDNAIGGFMRGQLVMIRGRSGCGKSLAAQRVISSNAFTEKRANIALFTYEMPYSEYLNRLVADIGTINLQSMFHGKYNKGEMDSFQRSMRTIMDSNLRIYDTDRVKKRTPHAFFSWTRKHAKNHGLDMVVLDHQHLLDMGGGKKSDKRTDEAMHDFSAEFKAMCLELKVVGLLLAQENTDGGTFGSTQVQTDVDHCFSLTPVWKLINNIKRIVGTDGMYCDKCRTGPLLGRKIPLKLIGQYARLEEHIEPVSSKSDTEF